MTIISRSVKRGGMVYVQAAASEPAGDMQGQTRQVLEQIEELLEALGASKSKLLTARVLLSDMSLREAHDAAWGEWINGQRPPLRTCKLASLAHPDALVEITVTAAK